MMYYNSYFLDTRYVIFQKGPFYPSCNKNDSIPKGSPSLKVAGSIWALPK